MPAAHFDLALEQGTTYSQQITWRQPNNPDGTPGAPMDLTGATAHMQIRTANANSGGTVLQDLTNGNGLVLGGVNGTITINLTAGQTGALTTARAVYDLYVTLSNGTVNRLLEGSVTVDPTVTQ